MAAKAPWKAYGRYGTVGFELIVSIALGFWVGHWLDGKYFPGKWYLTLLFTIGGVYTGFRALYKAAKKMEAEMEALDEREKKERDERIDRAIVRRKLLAVEKEIDNEAAESEK